MRETGVDALAVAAGTAHGQYKGDPKLDFDRLEEIGNRVSCPLVLHGSSGVSDASIEKAIARVVPKINIDTNILEAFDGAMRQVLDGNAEEIDPRKVLGLAREAGIEIIREKIRLFGSSGKA